MPDARPLRVWLSWSTGKDCAYTLHTLRQDPRYEVVGLLTTLNGVADRVAMHAVRAALLRAQAAATGLPVHEVDLPFPCTNEDYTQRMSAAVGAAKAAGVDCIAFGDLFLEDVRQYREAKMAGTGISTIFPIWGRDTAEMGQEILDLGMKAVLTCIDPKKLPKDWAGREYSRELLQQLPEGVDPCGENGEFHTFVYAGPMLQQPLDITIGEVVERDGFVFCDVLPAGVPAEGAADAGDGREQNAAGQEPQEAGPL